MLKITTTIIITYPFPGPKKKETKRVEKVKTTKSTLILSELS